MLDDSGPRRTLRYVFDISDTHLVQGGRTPYLWKLKEDQKELLWNHLADTYGLERAEMSDLPSALREIAEELAADSLGEAMEDFAYAIEGTYLEGLDEDTIRVEFRTLLTNSAFYSLIRRCGLETEEYLEEADFFGITDFNDLSALAFLGNATSQLVEPVLRDIGRTIRQADLEAWRQQAEVSQRNTEKTVEKKSEMPYNKFNTLIRESKNDEGGQDNGSDLYTQGRLPVPEPDASGRTSGDREIRDAAENLSEGTQEESVSEPFDEREAGQPLAGDRADGTRADGKPDGEPAENLSGSEQRGRADEVDGAHEQPDTDGGRNRADGIGIQLSEEKRETGVNRSRGRTSLCFVFARITDCGTADPFH